MYAVRLLHYQTYTVDHSAYEGYIIFMSVYTVLSRLDRIVKECLL